MANEGKTVNVGVIMNDFLKDIKNMFEKIAEVQKVMIEPIGRAMPEIASTLTMASNSFIQMNRKIEEIAKIASTTIDLNVLKKNLTDWIEAEGDKTSKDLMILVEIGWPPHGELTVRQLGYIADVYEKQKTEAVKQKIEQFFLKRFGEKEIRQMFGDWKRKEWLRKRFSILEEAVWAHFEGKYFLSVPAFLPQIEGIIADGFQHLGKMRGPELEEYYEKLLNNNGKYLLDPLDHPIRRFLFDYIVKGFEHGVGPQPPLSRHAILHGGDANYGTAANSLKCILLFDYIADKIDELIESIAFCFLGMFAIAAKSQR